MAQFQQQLRNTGGPEGPGTPRDKIEQAIALLQNEISAIEATMLENGCNETPIGIKALSFSSSIYGAVTLGGVILDKWLQCSSKLTANGQNLQEFLGLPVRPTQFIAQTNRQIDVQEFEHGAIINVEGTASPVVVYGAIYARYHQLGSLDSILGAPTADETDANPGRLAGFESGQIFWDPLAGDCHEVHGAILECWLALGGPAGPLGSPTTDEMPVIGHTGEIGRYQLFSGPSNSGAAIYFSAATGASEILAPIFSTGRQLRAAPSAALGSPPELSRPTPRAPSFTGFSMVPSLCPLAWHP